MTTAAIEELIMTEHYWRVPGDAVMVCALTLWNDYTVVGWAACVNPAEYDVETGKRLARAHALEQVTPLIGYEMATRRKWLKDHPSEVVEGALSGLA